MMILCTQSIDVKVFYGTQTGTAKVEQNVITLR